MLNISPTMIEGIISGLIANTIFLISIILIGWIIYILAQRHALLKFFGLKEIKSLSIYLSRLTVSHGGSHGVDGLSRNYAGIAVVFQESKIALDFSNLFKSTIPGIRDQSGYLSKIILNDIKFKLDVSPITENEINKVNTIISFGSPGYNQCSGWIQNTLRSIAKFTDDNKTIQFNDMIPEGKIDRFFVERIFDQNNKRYVFYLAGLHESGTIGAVHYLIKNWKKLHKKYKEKDFSILLSVNLMDFTDSRIISEFSE